MIELANEILDSEGVMNHIMAMAQSENQEAQVRTARVFILVHCGPGSDGLSGSLYNSVCRTMRTKKKCCEKCKKRATTNKYVSVCIVSVKPMDCLMRVVLLCL